MKLTSFFLLIVCLQVSARSYSQTISISGKNLSLPAIFSKIEKQTGLSFFYSYSLIKDKKPQDVEIESAELETALKNILQGQGLSFYREGKTIFIVKKSEEPAKKLGLLDEPEERQVDVRGKVTTEQGEPLVGATVSVKSGKRGSLTDEKGQFFLKGVQMESTIQVTYTGYKRIEVRIVGDAPLQIKLPIASSGLDEAQVIAYGATTERLNTGDVTTVKSADIEKQPVSNVLAALEGRVPGLLITQQNGMPGSSFTVQLRGINSIANGRDPFFVVDGVPYESALLQGFNPAGGSPFDYINPNDIESVSVLKDADATAIYGSRAANGAILITTKKGKAGKTRLDVNVNQGVGKAPLRIKWMNTPQYLSMRREAVVNDGDSLSDPNLYAPDILVWDTTRYTNWQKVLIGSTSAYTDAQVSLSGGNSNTQFLIGGNYHRETTVFPFPEAVPRGSVHVNVNNVSIDQRFRCSLTANYSVNTSKLPTTDLTGSVRLPPNTPPIYNKDGTLDLSYADWAYLQNPYAYEYQQYSSSTNNLVGNFSLSYDIIKGLELKASMGYTNMQYHDITTNPIKSQDPAYAPTGSANFTDNSIKTWIVEPQARYMIYTDAGHVEALIGTTFEQNESNGIGFQGAGYTSDALLQDLQAAPTIFASVSAASIYKYNALFGRINYNFRDKYLFNVSWRRDGSSRFGSANQFHDCGSIGAGYIFSKENFFTEKLPFLSLGKVRGSFGTTGNDQIGDYRYLNLYQPTSISYQNAGALIPTGLNNPLLAWEETKKWEGGLELGFLKDRIAIQASYYFNRSSNQLVGTPLPQITGFNSIVENLPATVQNAGWEFVLSTHNIKSRNFSWSSSFNLTIAHNKLISFPNLASSSYANSLVIGKPITIIKAFKSLGVDPATGVYEFADSNGKPTFTPNNLTDKTDLINLTPKFYGGFQNNFVYKHWDLSIMLSFKKQRGLNSFFSQIVAPGYLGFNEPKELLNSWQKPGDKVIYERFTQTTSGSAYNAYINAQGSTMNFVDASFVRLSNISLSYQLPSSWVEKMHLQSLSCYLHCQNILTITSYKGADPETQSLAALPLLRVFTGGIKVSL